jgi:hypothetical protein
MPKRLHYIVRVDDKMYFVGANEMIYLWSSDPQDAKIYKKIDEAGEDYDMLKESGLSVIVE